MWERSKYWCIQQNRCEELFSYAVEILEIDFGWIRMRAWGIWTSHGDRANTLSEPGFEGAHLREISTTWTNEASLTDAKEAPWVEAWLANDGRKPEV